MNSHFNYWYIKILKKIIGAMYKFKFPNIICRYLNSLLENYIQNKLYDVLSKSANFLKYNYHVNKLNNSQIIWMFWWQGIDDMPPIVRLCVKSVKHNSNNHKVILINKNNVEKYTDIPNYIYNKLNEGKITLTHFSDILRFNLLKNNGGLWLDSTMYCSSKLNGQYFKDLYTSGKYNDTIPRFVSGKWTGFLIGGSKNHSLFKFMDNYFKLYWKYNDYQIDYFLIDQGLYYAYNHNIGKFKTYIDKYVIDNNPHLFDLADLLNNSYNKYIYHMLVSDTDLFKLSYKNKLNVEKNTFYVELMNKYFDN